MAAGVVARRRGGGGPRGARPGFALGAAEEAPVDEDAEATSAFAAISVAKRYELCGNQPVCRVHLTILH